jgi:hypothetical protein
VTGAELESAWTAIEVPSETSALAGRRPPADEGGTGVLIAVDHAGNRHLLVEGPADARPPSTQAVKGLTVEVAELAIGERPPRSYFDVACSDPSLNQNFTSVAAEIIDRLESDVGDPRLLLERTFTRWRWFWGATGGGLSDTAAVGLFAELWFLERWLGPVDLTAIERWTGPLRDRHDFKSAAASVEVKATKARSDGSATHRITSLAQLDDPETGQLYLFSMRVTPDPIGGHSLARSVERLRAQLAGEPDALRILDERLGLAGYTPATGHLHDELMRVTGEEFFEVGEGFPRLIPSSFPQGPPAGVDDITYSLDLAACERWRIATKPTDPAARDLRTALLEPAS